MASNISKDSKQGQGGDKISTVKCTSCFKKRYQISFAEFACFDCVLNLCSSCSEHHIHENHRCKKMDTEEYRVEFRRMLEELRHEKNRREKFMEEKAEVCDRINVKSDCDYWHCDISGMCIAENLYSVMCDPENRCLKLFDLHSSGMFRRICLTSEAYDVTEVNIKMDENLSKPSSSGFSDVNRTGPSKPKLQSFIVATFPEEHEILYLNLTPRPAIIAKAIKTRLPCFSIECSYSLIYTVCREGHGQNCHWSVHMMSSDGDTINSVDTGIVHPGVSVKDRSYFRPFRLPYLAAFSGEIYLADWMSKEVKCINHEGMVISGITEKLEPIGICAAKDNGDIYLCTRLTEEPATPINSLYKMSHHLQNRKCLINLCSDSWYGTRPLCHYKDRVFICFSNTKHALRNYVTVIKLM